MNKKIAISLGLKIDKNNQLDYCIDTRWLNIANYLGVEFIPISEFNFPDKDVKFILLTGGNTIGEMIRRDKYERKIIEHVVNSNNKIGLLGICRGCQLINEFFGGTNFKVENHVNKKHQLKNRGIKVTCYHNFSPKKLGKNLFASDFSEDGYVEEIQHKFHNIKGIMWHPERENIGKISKHINQLFQ